LNLRHLSERTNLVVSSGSRQTKDPSPTGAAGIRPVIDGSEDKKTNPGGVAIILEVHFEFIKNVQLASAKDHMVNDVSRAESVGDVGLESVVKIVDRVEVVLISVLMHTCHEDKLVNQILTSPIKEGVNEPGPIAHGNRVECEGVDKHSELGAAGPLETSESDCVERVSVISSAGFALMEVLPHRQHLVDEVP